MQTYREKEYSSPLPFLTHQCEHVEMWPPWICYIYKILALYRLIYSWRLRTWTPGLDVLGLNAGSATTTDVVLNK